MYVTLTANVSSCQGRSRENARESRPVARRSDAHPAGYPGAMTPSAARAPKGRPAARAAQERRRRNPLPTAVVVACLAALVEAGAMLAVGVTLGFGGLTAGGGDSVVALGGFFVLLALLLVLGAWALSRHSALARGGLITLQLLLGASVVAMHDLFEPWLVGLGVLLPLVVLVSLMHPRARLHVGR